MSSSSIWPIDRTLSSATTLGQSGPRSNDNKGVLHIPQSSNTGASPSDYFVSYPRHSWWGLTPLLRCSQCILQTQLTGHALPLLAGSNLMMLVSHSTVLKTILVSYLLMLDLGALLLFSAWLTFCISLCLWGFYGCHYIQVWNSLHICCQVETFV